MPVRNGEALLEQAARSILDQTFTQLELVIVDDGAPEPTKTILRRLAAEDGRVVLLHGGRSEGIVRALNTGCAAARGTYLARMDSDDISLPQRLERQIALLEALPQLGLVGGQMIATDLAGAHLWPATYSTDDQAIRRDLGARNPFGHPTVVMRRSVFEQCGGYRDNCPHAEDYDLWVRMLDHCRGANLSDTVLLYRVHPGQTAFQDWRQHCISTLAVQAAVRVRRADGRDPLQDVELVTEETVRGLGVTETEIRTRFVESLLALSNLASHGGSRPERLRLLAQAQIEAGRGPVPRPTAARLGLVQALAGFEERRIALGISGIVRSARADRRAARALAGDWLARSHPRLFRLATYAKKVAELVGLLPPTLRRVP